VSKSTISRSFLDKMYRRLSEAKEARANASDERTRQAWDSLLAMVTRTIDDYLEAHAPAQAERERGE